MPWTSASLRCARGTAGGTWAPPRRQIARVLGKPSYRSVLERGYAVVRGEDGAIRRRAEAVQAGEQLTLTFADGERGATAEDEGGGPRSARQAGAARPHRRQGRQGTLF